MEFSMLFKLFFYFSTIILCFNNVLLVDGSSEYLNTNEMTPRAVASIYRWPNGVVPYTMASNFSASDLANIKQVMQEIQTSSCVKFIPRKTEKDYVSIVNYGACASSIGKVGGLQLVKLFGCGLSLTRTQFAKVLGFELAQKRFDRDNYIYVNLTNVPKGDYYYAKLSPAGWQLLNTPYDTQSVTHYYNNSGALNSKIPVMIAFDGSRIGGIFGKNFTKTDLLNINRLYNCDSKDCWNATNCYNGLGPLNWKSENYGQIVYANRCDFYNPNIKTSTAASHTLCGDLCLKNLDCSHFTWNIATKVCYQRRATNPYPLSISAIALPFGVCGYVNIRSPP